MAFKEDELYYLAEQSAVQYSYHPVGTLSVPRLAASKEYFKNKQYALVQKKKTIILADWSLEKWEDSKIQDLCTYLSELKGRGFTIYVWQNGSLEPFRDTLSKAMRDQITPATTDTLNILAQQYQLTADELFIVHDFDYLNESVFYPHKLYCSKFSHETIHSILAQYNPPIKSLGVLNFPEELNDSLKLSKLLNIEDPVISFDKGMSFSLDIQKLASIIRLSTIQHDNYSFPIKDCSFLKELSLYGGSDLSSEELTNFFKRCPALEWVKFEDIKQETIITTPVSTLKTLQFIRSDIRSEDLRITLNNTPNLTSLSLYLCKGLDEPLTLKSLLMFLKKLDISSFSPNTMLPSILNNAPSLEHLYINIYEMREFILNNPLLSLKSLVIYCSIPSNTLISLFKQSANLQTVELLFPIDLSLSSKLLDSIPLQLKELSFPDAVFLATDMTTLFKRLTALTHFKVKDYKQLNTDMINSLPAGLVSISLPSSPLSSGDLSLLLTRLPDLTCLDLRHCRDLSFLFNYVDNMHKITEIDLQFNLLSAEDLIQLINKFPNLKKLDLTGCHKLAQSKDLEALFLALERIANVRHFIRLPKETNSTSHNPKKYLQKSVPAAPFSYIETNKTKDQNRVINQLSQYLTHTNQHKDWIPRLQRGICNTLAHYCATKSCDEWQLFLQTISAWDGQLSTLNPPLKSFFEELMAYTQKYQLSSEVRDYTFVGNSIDRMLKNQAIGSSLVLKNPWHAVFIRKQAEDLWFFYDPNDTKGGYTDSEKNILEHLKYTQGELICISDLKASVSPIISNPVEFLENGGLLILTSAYNKTEILAELNKIEFDRLEEEAAFDGLLIRNVHDIPAYKLGLGNHCPEVREFTKKALTAYKAYFPITYEIQISALNNEVSPSPIVYSTIDDQTIVIPPAQPIMILPRKKHPIPDTLLSTWNNSSNKAQQLRPYLEELIKLQPLKKRLIELNSDQEVQGLYSVLHYYCTSISRPVFYVHAPDDLICSTPRPVRIGASLQGAIKDPSGPLYDFLTQNRTSANPPVLIVNYTTFKAQDIVRFNALLDKVKEHKADGILLPEPTLVLGLLNIHKPGCYRLADFYSRFKIHEPGMTAEDLSKAVSTCPFPAELLRSYIPSLPFSTLGPFNAECYRINLFHADNWKERLIGQWILQGDELLFVEGALKAAVASGKPILIENGCWEDESFQLFWQQASLTGQFPESTIAFNPHRQPYIRKEGYDNQELWEQVILDRGYYPKGIVLNPGTSANLLQNYVCEDRFLYTRPGLLEEFAHKTLHLNLTQDLSADQWAECLTQARHWNVQLVLHYIPGIDLSHPNKAIEPLAEASPIMLWKGVLGGSVQIIVSPDPDTTVDVLTQDKKNCLVWNISECEASHLLGSLKGECTAEKKFKFTTIPSSLIQALEQELTIILTGYFSSDLVNGLAPLLLNPSWNKGRLLLVHNQADRFAFTQQYRHEITPELQRSCLEPISEAQWAAIQTEQDASLSVLKSRLTFYRAHPEASPDNAWLGMRMLPALAPLQEFQLDKSQEQAAEFNQRRLEAVETVLKDSPFVYLTGWTSVGKTTFVRRFLKTEHNYYEGVSNIAAWANNTNNTRKILFWDEANFGQPVHIMEGLFYNPPGLFFEGVYYPLDEHHKVVFAGNPLIYGGDRSLASFFIRHGATVLFEPLSLANIYEDILKPIFTAKIDISNRDQLPRESGDPCSTSIQHWVRDGHQETRIEPIIPELVQPMFKAYQFLCRLSQKEVLITPRELQMMALLVHSYTIHGGANPQAAAEYYAYHLSEPLVPSTHKNEFIALFNGIPKLEERRKPPLLTSDFLITPERQPLCDLLIDLLELRLARQNTHNFNYRYGGLGGLILEGEPGIGKSECAVHILVSQGFSEQPFYSELPLATQPQKHFYRLPVSWSTEAKEALLVRAFQEGAVVLIDEINSSPRMEQLLNSLLMGTDLQGNSPKFPGFTVIGTQNPTSMAGRNAPSKALFHRFITVVLNPYPDKDMHAILCALGLHPDLASDLIEDYQEHCLYAQKHNLTPAPCFRDLITAAKCLLNTQGIPMEPVKADLNTRSTETKDPGILSYGLFKVNKESPRNGASKQEPVIIHTSP